MARGQEFRRLNLSLAAGAEFRGIKDGCRYLTIYRCSPGASLEIREFIDGNDGNWVPLPYGFSVGFKSSRGVSFRNPGTEAANYVVLYGEGPFADNRQIVDPESFDSTSTFDPNSLTYVRFDGLGYATRNVTAGGNNTIDPSVADASYRPRIANKLITVTQFTISITSFNLPFVGTWELMEFTGSTAVRTINSVAVSVDANSTRKVDLLGGIPRTTIGLSNYVSARSLSSSTGGMTGGEVMISAYKSYLFLR